MMMSLESVNNKLAAVQGLNWAWFPFYRGGRSEKRIRKYNLNAKNRFFVFLGGFDQQAFWSIMYIRIYKGYFISVSYTHSILYE